MSIKLNFTIGSLLDGADTVAVLPEDQPFVDAVLGQGMKPQEFRLMKQVVRRISVTNNFKEIVSSFDVATGQTPAGFRIEAQLQRAGNLAFDLIRDIGYEANGKKRATPLIFSADTANPYEVSAIKDMIGNLTCNPGIIYDLFLNNPKANVGNKYTSREEVMSEIGSILGAGCDISVELNDPFEPSFDRILEELAPFEQALNKHRLVVKIPHTGPVNGSNVSQLLTGTERLDRRYDQGSTEDYLRGHNLALKLQQMGYRTNFTLMFEPYQIPLALQARPTFINAFVRHRLLASHRFKRDLAAYDAVGDKAILSRLAEFMVENDYLSGSDGATEPEQVYEIAQTFLKQRHFDCPDGADGLDNARAGLRWLKTSNMPETRLIICSMQGADNLPDIFSMLSDEEFRDMQGRVVITSEPNYIASFSSSPQVVAYQRRFMKASQTDSKNRPVQ